MKKSNKKWIRKKGFSKKKLLVLVIIIASIGSVYAITMNNSQTATGKYYGTIEERIKNLERGGPSVRPDYLPTIVYKNLPDFPEDFYPIKNAFHSSIISDLTTLGEEYYKQPEFYPSFENNIGFIANPDLDRYYPLGYGVFPGDTIVEVGPGDEFTIATLFHASWLVQNYQGVKVDIIYPSRATIKNSDMKTTNRTVTQDPASVRNYFDIFIAPEVFLLDPSSPIFGKNWTQKVDITVHVSPDTPEGDYVIGLNPGKPPRQFSAAMKRKYLMQYSEAGASLAGRPLFQLTILVRR